MKPVNRRKFIKDVSRIASGAIVGGYLLDSALFSPEQARAAIVASVYIAKNGSPADNVAKVIEMRYGGIEKIIGPDDVVVLNPNGQWPRQGGANCACCMGLIDLILNRPGGFNGEIIFTECTQFQMDGYWTATEWELERNGPYNFLDMIAYYQNAGHANVNGVRIWRNIDDPTNWPVITGPQQGQGWVRLEWLSPGGHLFGIPYPVIRSPYSDKLIDLRDGVYDNGFTDQPSMKFIKIPNLNNHGTDGNQDYAGITSATKSFLGISEVINWGTAWPSHNNLHSYDQFGAYAVGQAIAAWMDAVRKPDFFLTTAEWVGWGSRTHADATQARTVGLCEDPVSLDYYMSKYVLWPTYLTQQYFNPDYDISNNNTRLTLDGCNARGYGTVVESEIAAFIYDYSSPATFRFEIDRMIRDFRQGSATEQQVLDLIERYNEGQ